eukprot:SAG31_NODE_4003_length_3674_cov_7.299860_1_plen_115_part_10
MSSPKPTISRARAVFNSQQNLLQTGVSDAPIIDFSYAIRTAARGASAPQPALSTARPRTRTHRRGRDRPIEPARPCARPRRPVTAGRYGTDSQTCIFKNGLENMMASVMTVAVRS